MSSVEKLVLSLSLSLSPGRRLTDGPHRSTKVVMGDTAVVSTAPDHPRLVRRGRALEYTTLGWNVVGVAVLAVAAVAAGSVAAAGFGLDSLIEIGASTVVLWQLADTADPRRQHRATRLIGACFVLLVVYLVVQVAVVLAAGTRPAPSPAGITWTAATFVVMLALASAKTRTGTALGNPVLLAEGRVTLVDAFLAGSVLVGLILNAVLGWWWADPLAGLVIVYYAVREAHAALRPRALP